MILNRFMKVEETRSECNTLWREKSVFVKLSHCNVTISAILLLSRLIKYIYRTLF